MVFPMVILKLVEWFLYHLFAKSCYRAVRKISNYTLFFKNSRKPPHFLSIAKCGIDSSRKSQTLVCDMHATLLKSQSLFPYFMLVAFEGGSIFRAGFLLLSSPLLWVLDHESKLKVMVFITFFRLRLKKMECVGRGVMPKFFIDNLNLEACEVFESTGRKMVFTSIPRVMVEGFLKEYLGVDAVVGTELELSSKGYFTGFFTNKGLLVKHKALMELFHENDRPDIGIGGSKLEDHLFISLCKEAYVVSKEDMKTNTKSRIPVEKYLKKPLVFHDGRLAFFPTPLATLFMFLWLPIGVPLAFFRFFIGMFLPYKLSNLLAAWSGVVIRSIKGSGYKQDCESDLKSKRGHVLYVCTHRTLLDPVFLSTSLEKPLTAVTYSLSKTSEMISPIKTVRLTRDRQKDGETMHRLLKQGDLVVCPEGTTCREPYLLRFSSLFAELTDEIVPVAMNTHVSMFYGTTASGLKCLDPVFFLMNPRPSYDVQVLGKVSREMTCAGGKSSFDVANNIQRQLAEALGFECTTLTRKDKYRMLAGNEGVVQNHVQRHMTSMKNKDKLMDRLRISLKTPSNSISLSLGLLS